MLVSSIGIAVVILAGVGVWQLIGGGGDDGAGTTAGEWDRIALVDRTSGAVTFVDADGEAAAETDESGRVLALHTHADRLALVGSDQIALTSIDGDLPVLVPIERGSTVTPYSTDDTFHLLVGDDGGGNVVIVDGTTGDPIDVGELTGQGSPLIFPDTVRQSVDGRRFALADAARFRTILVTVDEAEPRYFPDQPIAVGDELIATSQVIDREADVTLSDLDRETQARTTVAIPADGMLVGERLLVISTDGTLSALEPGDEDAERVAAVAVPAGDLVTSMTPTLDGERLVVSGTTFEAVLDLDGTTVFTTTFTGDVDALRPDPGWHCLPVGGEGGFHSLVSLDTGEQLADLTGLDVTGTASDGCTVIGERDDTIEVVGADGTVRLDTARLAVIGPDGRTVVRRALDGSTELIRLGVDDDALGIREVVPLDDVAPANLAIAFVDG
jgi:hypothetical protein